MKINKINGSSRILLIDDEEIMHDVFGSLLGREGYHLDSAYDGHQGLEMFASQLYDLILLDLMLPGKNGMEVLRQIRALDPHAVVIMITAYGTIEAAVQATRDGAYDFTTKPFKNEEILVQIKNGLHKRRLEMENYYLKQNFQAQYSFDAIVGKSPQMQSMFRLIQQVAPTKSTVLIVGESGTGKELVAKAIHNCSNRSDAPFIAVNCGNIPTELLESELFGYKKGAFTGAVATKKGLFEVANQGTIFLDEIGNISIELQAKLLRVIQEREFRRLGDVESIKVDVRILAASNEDLHELVKAGRFREDLYYRLNVIKIEMPPLRKRREDIPLLAEHFIRKICQENNRTVCGIEKAAMEVMMDYPWPGNVRELENVIERVIVLSAEGGDVSRDTFPPEMVSASEALLITDELPEEGVSLRHAVLDFEKNLIIKALQRTGGNQKKAAELLKLNATTLNEKIKRLEVNVSEMG